MTRTPIAVAVAVAVGFVVAVPSVSEAYLPPAWFVMKKMAERCPAQQTFMARGSVRIAGRDGVFTRVMLFQAGRVRVETRLGDGVRVEVWDGSRRLLRAAGATEVEETAGPENPIGLVLGSADVFATLKGRGLETRVSLSHERGRAMYVVGAREKGKLQVWVDRDGFTPARIVTADAELRFSDYDLTVTRGKFPRVVEVFADGSRVETFAVESFESGVAVPENAFDRTGMSSNIK